MQIGDRWWSAVAPVYDAAVSVVKWYRYQDALVAGVDSGLVLDVGCGPAHLATGLLSRGVRYVGVDRNGAMLARAKRRIASSGGRGALVRADVTALPFKGDTFDLVVAAGVLGLLDLADRQAALSEVARVSRRGVRLLEPVSRPDWPRRQIVFRLVALVNDRPLDLAELSDAGLDGALRGRPVIGGIYSTVHATKASSPPR